MRYQTWTFDGAEYHVFNFGQTLEEYFDRVVAVSALRTPGDVRARLALIDAQATETNPCGARYVDNGGSLEWSSRDAHQQSDDLWLDVLKSIADGVAVNPAEMARLALTTVEWNFSRWYA